MRAVVVLALLQLAAPRGAPASGTERAHHGVIHEAMLEGVTFQEYGHRADGEDTLDAGVLLLEPASLAFGARPLGTAHVERVTLTNRSNSTLRLASISGSTHNFHASFFESKVIPPQGNTSFNVVFLGRREGPVDTHLYIHTSLGTHKYAVSGVGVMSEYRLSPLVGVKLPQNTSFSPTIYMHNPHPYPIQIMEVYSSGGGVTLELPDGGREGPQSLWLLPPHTTRALVRVHYAPPPPPYAQHTAYIRIKLNGTSPTLVVPVEVGLEREAGPYVRPHAIHAGLGGTGDPPSQIRLSVGNSGAAWVSLRQAGLWGGAPACEARGAGTAPPVEISLIEHSVPPFAPPNHVATLTVYWDRVYESGACYGEIHLTTAEHCLTVPYHAHALPGALVYNASLLSFVTSSPDVMIARDFTVRNDFAHNVHVTDVLLSEEVKKYFVMRGFSPQSVPAGSNAVLFSLRLRDFDATFVLTTSLTLVTNVTSYHVPVYVYSGKLALEWQWPGHGLNLLDLGVVHTSSTTQVTGSLNNTNPVPVCVESWGAEMEGAALQFLGCVRSNTHENATSCVCIPPGEVGLVSVSVVAPAREAQVRGKVWLQTNHARLQVTVSLRAARGRLTAKHLHLNNCFPGTICSERLRLDNTLPFSMQLLNVTQLPADPRIYHEVEGKEPQWEIPAQGTSFNGRVFFDAALPCRPRCYTSLRMGPNATKVWMSRPDQDEDWLVVDGSILNHNMQLYQNLAHSHNFTLRLHTSEVRNQHVSGSAWLMWPRLWSAESGGGSAGLVGVGAGSSFNITLKNPSNSQPIYIHVLLPDARLHKVPLGLRGGECDRPGCTWSPRSFRITSQSAGTGQVLKEGEAPMFFVPALSSVNVEITFVPSSAAPHTSLLFLRNNLTILEAVRLTGLGVFPSFKFGNRKPGSGTPLLFELTEKHLKDCDGERSRLTTPPNLTVKRSFTARNTGDIPIIISTFFINGYECEGYGFKVLNCQGFELEPNATHKVDIAFTPDFTLSKIRRTLIFVSSLSTPVNYSLETTVPAHLLAPCGAALSRPPWETYLRNATVSFMIMVGLCVLGAGFFESDRILKMAMAAMARNSVVHPPLDLRSIGQCGKPWEWSDPPKENAKTPVWTEDRRLSEDSKLTKYEEVAPPKTKKKVSKRQSNEPAATEIVPEKEVVKEKKDDWIFTPNGSVDHKSDENSTPPSETAPLLPTPDEKPKILDLPKKIFNLNKNKREKPERRPARCEEDASSTATESSNNDETEKEPEQPPRASADRTIAKKTSPANNKKKCPSQYKDSYEGDGEDEEYDRPNKPSVTPAPYAGLSLKFQRNKDTNTPTPTRQNKQEDRQKTAETKPEIQPQETVHQKPKTINKFTNNKKEKIPKKKIEKVYQQPAKDITNISTNHIQRNSPPAVTIPSSRWGENRATFSDVVARSDNTYSTVVAPKKPEIKDQKPKETYSYERKKEKVPLGPIGSNFYQKRSPTRRTELEDTSLYSHPVRQITDPVVPKPIEELVSADNNNSFFYFGNDSVRAPEVIPAREVGVIGKPTVPAFKPPIGQSFGQIGVNYSPSIMEDYGGLENGRMDFDSAWEPTRNSPGLISAPTSQSSAFPRTAYSGDTTSTYTGLWDMPPTTVNSAVGGAPSNAVDDKTAHAQWLWGVPPPPGFPPTQQPVRPFDPFQSMSSIWSPGTLDHWTNGRIDNDTNGQH